MDPMTGNLIGEGLKTLNSIVQGAYQSSIAKWQMIWQAKDAENQYNYALERERNADRNNRWNQLNAMTETDKTSGLFVVGALVLLVVALSYMKKK
jgi:hypothetical protein